MWSQQSPEPAAMQHAQDITTLHQHSVYCWRRSDELETCMQCHINTIARARGKAMKAWPASYGYMIKLLASEPSTEHVCLFEVIA